MIPIKRFRYFLLIATLLMIGCDFSTLLAQPPIPSPNPNTIQSIIRGTAAAAGSQTAVLIPPTLTPSFTPFPSATASITPTSTETFVFAFPTVTRPPAPTQPKGGVVITDNGSWGCQVVDQTPSNGTTYNPNDLFSVNWMLKNTGGHTWLHSSIDIVNIGGPTVSSAYAYNTYYDVSTDSSETVTIDMMAPSSAGTYSSNWALRKGVILFCPVSITFTVK